MPVDPGRYRVEERGSLGEIGLHVCESLDGGAFNDVQDGVADERWGEEFSVDSGEVCDDGTAEGVAHEHQRGSFGQEKCAWVS